jgi:hypothetical protein
MATLRKPKMVNPVTGRSPHRKKATKPLYAGTYARGSMTEAERDRVAKEFSASGCKLVWVEHVPGTERPFIERMTP